MSFQQGLSGLSSSGKTLDVVGNNIANASTVGFKGAQAQFADVFAASLSGASTANIGLGAKLATVAQQFTQGNISTTNNALDVAINGGGFYIVSNGGSNYYSRNGQFQVDSKGYMVTSTGMNLQGVPLDKTAGTEAGTLGKIQLFNPLAASDSPAQATGTSANKTGVVLGINLDPREASPTVSVWNPATPTSFNQTSAITVYDSVGNQHSYALYYVKTTPGLAGSAAALAAGATAVQAAGARSVADAVTQAGGTSAQAASAANASMTAANQAGAVAAVTALGLPAALQSAALAVINAPLSASAFGATAAQGTAFTTAASAIQTNQWDVYATVTNPSGSATGTASQNLGKLGSLVFNTNGSLASPSGGVLTQAITDTQLGYTGGVVPMSFGVNFASTTQYGSSFTVNTAAQDGFASGKLSGFAIGSDGTIKGNYTNGQTQFLYRIQLASFRNPQGLQSDGANVWSETANSGQPTRGYPGDSGSYGPLQSSATEDSNVDITQELIAMITAQRVYQANAQTIKTQDQVLQTLVNLR